MSASLAPPRESFLRALSAGALWRGLEQAASLGKHVVIAGAIGLSAQLDVFYMANALLTIAVFGWGHMLDALAVPRLVALREEGEPGAFEALAGGLMALSLLAGAAFGLATLWGSGPLSALAVGFDPARRAMLQEAFVWLVPVAALTIPFHCLGSLLRASRRFTVFSQSECLVTIAALAAIALFPAHPQVLLWSYSLGLTAAFAYMLLRARGTVALWAAPLSREVRACLEAAPALVLIQVGLQLYHLSDRLFVSFLPARAVGALSYGWVLVSLVPAVIMLGGAFITVFAEQRNAFDGGAAMLDRLIGLVLLAGLPAAAFLLAFGDGLIGLLLERGLFGSADTALTAQALAGYALGLPAMLLLHPLKQVFQVLGRNDVLLLRVGVGLVLNVALNGLLVLGLGWGLWGLALSTSVCQLAMLVPLFRALHAEGLRLDWRRHGRWAAHVLAGSMLGLAAAFGLARLGEPAWLVLAQALLFAGVVAGWCLLPPSPEGPLVRATLGRLLARVPARPMP